MAEVAQTFIDNSAAREQQALLRQQRLAEILQSQAYQAPEKFGYAGIEAPPSGAAALAKGLQSGVAGYLQGRSLKGQDDLVKKTEARETKYGQGLAKALSAGTEMREGPRPSPDFVGPMPEEMGGYKAIAAALQEIDNPDVTRTLGPQMAMAQIQQQQAGAKRVQDLQDAKDLRLAPTYQAPVAGRDVPLPPDVQAQQIEQARARATAAMQPPVGYTPTPQGALTATPGGPADPAVIAAQEEAKKRAAREQAAARPVPAQIIKMERDDRESINTTETINSTLAKYQGLIKDGKQDLGPMANVISQGRNYVGASDENSRNFASFRSDLEKLRNDSLRLNAGVQTDGDAQRAWNELMANLNDPKVVAQRLGEIQGYNQRAAAIKSQNLDQLYDQYPGLKPKTEVPATSQQPQSPSAEDAAALQWANANPNDPRAAAIKQRLGM